MLKKEDYEKTVDDIFFTHLSQPSNNLKKSNNKSKSHNNFVEEFTCPVCLENVDEKVELNCGHRFCKECLKTAAANNFNACFLCRRYHELNPVILKEQFDKERLVNLGWRVGWKGRGPRDHSVRKWADPFIQTPSSSDTVLHRARNGSINEDYWSRQNYSTYSPKGDQGKGFKQGEYKQFDIELTDNNHLLKAASPLARKNSYSLDDIDLDVVDIEMDICLIQKKHFT